MSGASSAGSGNGQAPTQSPASPGSGNGQAPTTPPANNGSAAPTGGAPNGQAPTATTDTYTPPSAEEWKRVRQELDESRRDAAKYRDNAKKLEDAQLTAEQKRERDYSEMQAKNLEMELRLQQQALQISGYRLGAQLGIGDVGAALALVQTEHAHEIKFSATDGTPENLPELLKAVLKDHPALAATNTPGSPQRPPAASGGATNPAGGGTGTGGRTSPATITRASYAAMSPQDRLLRNKEVLEVMRQNGGKLPD